MVVIGLVPVFTAVKPISLEPVLVNPVVGSVLVQVYVDVPPVFIVENGIPYCESNVIKYVCRWQYKHPTKQGQIDDLKKARQYIDILIKKAETS